MRKLSFKKLLAAAGAVTFSCSALLSGCAPSAHSSASFSAPSSASGNPGSGPEIDLTFWHSMGGVNAKALQSLTDQFNSRQNGRIKVTLQYQGNYDDTLNKFKTAMVSKSGPDILQSYDLGTRYLIDSGYTEPVQNYIDRDKWDTRQIDPNIAAYYTVDNKLHSMPFNSSTPIMYYNKNAFKAAGLTDSDVPKTFGDIVKLVPKLTKKDASGTVAQYTAGMYVYGWFMDQSLDKMGLPLFNNGNGRTKAPTRAVMDSNGGGAAFLKAYHSLITSGAMPAYAMDNKTGETAFENGKLAIYIDSTSEVRGLLTAIGGKFEIGTAYFPGVDANSKGGVSVGGGSLWMMKNSDARVQAAKWEFIKYMVSPEKQAFWNTQTGYFPVNVGAYSQQSFKDNIRKYPQFQTAIDQLHASTPNSAGGLCAIYTQARKIQETEMQKMMNNQESENDALNNICSQLNSALSDYNAANLK